MNKSTSLNTKIALQAITLLGQWNRLSQVHLSLGAGCMCVGSLPGLAVSDLEIHILEYLREKYDKHSSMGQWLSEHAEYKEGLSGSITELLKSISTHPPSTQLALQVLKDLGNTIASLDASHQSN